MKEKHIAMCGLDCSSCAAYIETKNGDNNLRRKTAENWSLKLKIRIKPKDINCFGCISKNKPVYKNCSACEVKRCGLEGGLKNCKECKEYQCTKLIKLQKHLF